MNGPFQFSWDSRANHREAILRSLKDSGSLLISNLGISSALVSHAVQAQRKVFELPESAKRRHCAQAGPSVTGYIPYATESAGGTYAPDPKEGWHISENKSIRNFWPEEVPEFKQAAEALLAELPSAAAAILDFFGDLLDRRAYFSELLQNDESILRMVRYSNAAPEGVRLAESHRDIGLFTLHLFQSQPGFQTLASNGWNSPVADKGVVMITAGEMLEFISDGAFRAPVHRVLNHGMRGEHREYAGYFVHPSADSELKSANSSKICRDMITDRLADMRLLKVGET